MKPLTTHPCDGVAWVTGASSGLGLAVVEALVAQGWTVVASARREQPLQALAQRFPGRVHALPLDVTQAEEVKSSFARAQAEHGPVALAVLAAGIHEQDGPLMDAGQVARVLGTNVMGCVHCLEPLLASMVARGCGQVVVVGSVAGFGPLPTSAAYGASKAALTHLLAPRYRALKRQGVLLQLCSPGFIQTPMLAANRFPTPFLLSAPQAAQRVLKGLSKERFEHAFPWPLVWTTKAFQALPWELYLWVTDVLHQCLSSCKKQFRE